MTDLSLAGELLSDAVPEALVVVVARDLLGANRDVYETVPGFDGSVLFGEHPGDRSIKVKLNLLGEAGAYPLEVTGLEARRAAIRALATWLDQPGRSELIVDDEPDRYWLARYDDVPTPEEWLNHADLELTFRVGAYAFALELSTEAWSSSDATPHDFTIDDDVEARPVIEVTAAEDLPAGFELNVNASVLTYGTPVANGDTITVSGLGFTVSAGANEDLELDGTFDVETLSMADVDGDFPLLAPGANTITVSNGDANVVVTWRRRFR